ncbi:MAG: DNA photolyase family protein [Gammaproteobacteria bacterium]|nr:DNA photolyase family protein [Gammaproteobacteria bacterium]
MTVSILWFRRDLRIHDNAALQWVCDNSTQVIPIYIHSLQEEKPWQPGAASRWWLHNSLLALEKKLADHGLRLKYFCGESETVISKIIEETNASSLVYNRLYEPHLHKRDLSIEKKLQKIIEVLPFENSLFFAPGSILNNQQLPYRVFTPFYKKIRPLLTPGHVEHDSASLASGLKSLKDVAVSSAQSLISLNLLDEPNWHEKLHSHWRPGEDHAFELLDAFIDDAISHYDVERDIPSIEATSRLSPYLHFGEITAQQICHSIWPLLEGQRDSKTAQSAEVFLKQLVWREFAHNVLWHFPETATEPMDKRYKKSFWRSSKRDYHAWTRGETGVPIIDAGMKQLWETGWMHNRVRMIVSSFLTKNLGLNWLQGANWFWDTLVDADLANNSLGWQWVAGCGVDAAPYYRVFNPNTQTKRFDSNFIYINTWLPEHNELDYPQPMIDLASSRDQALDRYKQNISS